MVAPKLSDDLLLEAQSFIDNGLTKERLASKYREPNWTGMRTIATQLESEFGRECKQKHVYALFHIMDIEQWTPQEKRIAEKNKPENLDNTQNKAKELDSLGFTNNELARIYLSENRSKNEIIEIINDKAGKLLVNKKWVNRIFAYHSIADKPAELINVARNERIEQTNLERYGVPHAMQSAKIKQRSHEGTIANGGYTLQRDEHKSNVLAARSAAAKATPRRPEVLMEELGSKGYSEAVIRHMYGAKNLSVDEIVEEINTVTAMGLTKRRLERLLDYLQIKKTADQIYYKRGSKSRAEKAANLARLEAIGHTPESAAAYYENNTTITWFALLDEFNSLLNDDSNPFTEKWIVKTLSPHFSEEFKKLRGSSRAENNFGEWLRSVYDGPVEQGRYRIIPKYQLDFYMPELNLAIEFNGDYWHSDEFLLPNHGMTARAYHELKRDLSDSVGVKVAFVWESDWYYKRDEVEADVMSFLANPANPSNLLTMLEK